MRPSRPEPTADARPVPGSNATGRAAGSPYGDERSAAHRSSPGHCAGYAPHRTEYHCREPPSEWRTAPPVPGPPASPRRSACQARQPGISPVGVASPWSPGRQHRPRDRVMCSPSWYGYEEHPNGRHTPARCRRTDRNTYAGSPSATARCSVCVAGALERRSRQPQSARVQSSWPLS